VKKDENNKKKSVPFKASTSSKSEGEKASEFDDKAMALFVRKMGIFMKKKGYGARKREEITTKSM
jgi:hypothetical protein